MTLGEKLTHLRKTHNYTQEQFADLLGVSRQSVSKWESDLAYPETEKLIRISDLYSCSLDYLMKDMEDTSNRQDTTSSESINLHVNLQSCRIGGFRIGFQERKSEKFIKGIPLWHIGRNAKGIIAIGLNARGIIAIGAKATGIISLGFLSFGVISMGLLSLGLLAMGTFAVGIAAAGAICLGILSVGAIAIGEFSFGALAVGRYLAIGDVAKAAIALGDSDATGSVYQHIGSITSHELSTVRSLLEETVPTYLRWAKAFIQQFL